MNGNNNDSEKTYKSKGMLYGVAAGSIIGAIIARLTDTETALAFCISVGMLLGLAITNPFKRCLNKWRRKQRRNGEKDERNS